ncbi:sigma-54-dependent Fis family transcriptional regulator [Ideonella sp. 4Y16]|uniref:Sigma-54-dependent Fis family transcriptional regulator n=1 Tax=Ideonella alba TaxID=2824118 RepID=A0A940YKF8_9BURK|nr:sigma-54-dependent Fis family transcriptional regulator [Ideonella alba]MBQ0931469.1 sigma-54-dependent Fis family transcriptional regulator [Ideonella alba]MBQ0943774.1 sigma-54-dependent Fis family transcriptional regulator [Ideonella alba]
MHHALTPVLPPADVREARRQLNNSGEVSTELLGPLLARSWQRCASAGLQPDGRTPGTPHASAAQLARALELQRDLLSHARPVMEFLHEQTRDTDSMVILADAQGMLLHALGDDHFIDRAERVALRPGANWHERWRGTNAIGTALQEAQPVSVHAGEHYLERNGFLTCAAAPIHDPTGRVLGALDLSGDHRGFHRHTLGLVRSAVRMIEHGLFQSRHGQGLRLRLHAQRDGLGSLTEGLLALSEDGWLVGANDTALKLLGLGWADVAARRLPDLLALDTLQLLASAHRGLRQPQATQTRDGRSLWWIAEADRQTVASLRTPVPAPALPPAADALAALDTGDSALRAALERARRVQGKPIALLLLGESGVGKEVFARAVHASGPRREQAFVAVNCAALPDTLIEAELFGYRPGAFTGAHRDGAPGRIREADGGTLFLDEIGDMPLAMQGRLLRVLQERQVTPLGGGKPVPVNIQLMCATHRPLREDMKAGRFREDLYYRINGLALQLPALRDRQDLAELVRRLLGEIRPGLATVLSPELATLAARYAWPGNLRQLANALRTACALMDEREDEIGWEHLPDDLAEDLRQLRERTASAPGAAAAEGTLRELERQQVEAAMALARGNVSEAARRLGVSRNTLYRRLRQSGH